MNLSKHMVIAKRIDETFKNFERFRLNWYIELAETGLPTVENTYKRTIKMQSQMTS